MSENLEKFFAKVTADPELQKRLYVTKKITDVAFIAQELGFDITAAEILRAQADRVLSLSEEDLAEAAAGKKPKSGAQWGRAGKGYLDHAGFWVNEFTTWDCRHPPKTPALKAFLSNIKFDQALKAKLLRAKTHYDVAELAQELEFIFTGTYLLRYQAQQILLLSDEQAQRVAAGAP